MGIKVLSLFDGISCGRLALERAEIEVDSYYSSEIDKFALKVATRNYPNNVQVGDATKVTGDSLPKIDLLIGGSPCQGFSFAGKQLNFDDPRSKLFFEFVRVLKETKPKYFLLENVKMKKEYQDVISKYLGVEPIEINSSLLSAQNRVRLYWTNIPGVEKPKDKGVKLKHILDNWDMMNKSSIIGRRLNEQGKREDYNKDIPIIQYLENRGVNMDKSNCLTTVAKDNVLTFLPKGRYGDAFKDDLPWRYYSTTEYCRLQTVPTNYFGDVVSDSQIRKMLGNGWTVDVIAHIMGYIKGDKA